jgi:hypothetical protein
MTLFSLPILAQLPDPNVIDPCPTGLSCAPDVSAYIFDVIINGPRGIMVGFFGVLFAMLVIYAVRLLLGNDDEEQKEEAKRSYGHAIFGTILVLGATTVSMSFTTLGGVNPAPTIGVVEVIIFILKGLVATLLVMNIFIQGVRLIVVEEESHREKARKRFIHGMIATAIIILATPIVDTAWTGNIGIATGEILGIANFLATIFGVLATVALVVAGLMLVISIDDQLKDRAKKIIIASIVTIAVVISSYGLVTIFIL